MTSRYSAAGGAHQRGDLRTQLFSTPGQHNFTGIRLLRSQTPPLRSNMSSPYDPTPRASSSNAKFDESLLSSLESQDDEELNTMGAKINMLKNLGEKMGVEINKLVKLNDEITNGFERGKVTLKNTYNKMVVMSQRAGISWKMWLLVFGIVVLFFFYVWIT